ncbi:MAG: hypothetical protein ACI4XW_01105 [Candidatus Spyradocola sp.]
MILTIALAACCLVTSIVGGAIFCTALMRTVNHVTETALERPAKPEAAPTPTPVPTPEPAQAVPADRVEMERSYENGQDHATIHAYAGNTEVWTCVLPPESSSELDSFAPIGILNGQYLYCAVGTVRALDLATGDVVWENSDFGGALAEFDSDENGNIYLTGWYGPDFFMMDKTGNTIKRIGTLNDAYYWPIGIEKLPGNAVEVTMSMYDLLEAGEYRLRVHLDDWSCEAPKLETRAWREAYVQEIASEEEEYGGYLLLNVGLDYPVLYRNGYSTAQGDAISYYDERTNCVNTCLLGIDSLWYIPGHNLLCEAYGHMGVYGDNIYTIVNNDFALFASGEYEEDEHGGCEYEWMGHHVSEQEYQQKLNEVFPADDAMYPYDWTYSRAEMLDQLLEQ